jgi:hypothetical protein
MRARISVLVASAAAVVLAGWATSGSAREAAGANAARPVGIDNFVLADTDRVSHELYRMGDAKVVVLVTQANGCPIVRNLAPPLRELTAKYEGQGVRFLMLNSAIQDSVESIAKERAEFAFDAPILKDADQRVGEQLGVTRTAEFIVVDPKTWKIAYRGPLDDRLDYGTQKARADHTWAANAIDATLAGRPAVAATKPTAGCLIDFPNRGKRAPSAGGR